MNYTKDSFKSQIPSDWLPSQFFLNLPKGDTPTEHDLEALRDFIKVSGLTENILEEAGVRINRDKGKVLERLKRKKLRFETAVEIPYYNQKGEVVSYRYRFYPPIKIGDKEVKYLSPKGNPFVPYIPPSVWQISEKPHKPLWITEGEKKALKLIQEGAFCVALPGVWMFREKNTGRLHEALNKIKWKGRTVYLAFDMDLYENPQVRQAFYALAFLLYGEGAVLKVPTWPKSQGKGIDDYLTNTSRKPAELEDEAKPFWEFPEPNHKDDILKALKKVKGKIPELEFSQLCNIASDKLKISQDDLSQTVSDSRIFEKDGKTWARGEKIDFLVANFVAEIEAQCIDDERKITWRLKLTAESGDEASIEIPGEDIALSSFEKAILRYGPFVYRASSKSTHYDFWRFLLAKGYDKLRKTQFLGRVAKDLFLFSNQAITTEGPKDLYDIVPPKSRMSYKEGGNLKEIVKNFVACYGEERAWKIFGFAVGTIFVEEISEAYGFFPVLFLTGSKGSGKSKLAELITWLFGAGRELKPINFNTTSKAIQRLASRFKGIPITINEYQSNPTRNNRLILSLYDREGYGMAKKDNTLDTIMAEVNCSCIVISTQNPSGEEREAVLSRLIEINMDFEKDSRRKEVFNWLWRNRELFCCFVSHCMKEIRPEELLKAIHLAIKTREEVEIPDQRTIEIHSIIEACSRAFYETLGIEKLHPGTDDIDREALDRAECLRRCSIVGDFETAIENLITQGNQVVRTWTRKTGSEFCLCLSKVYPEAKKYLKQADIQIPDQRTMARLLKAEGYKPKTVRMGPKNEPTKAWVTVIQSPEEG